MQLSDDGNFMWNGNEWLPVESAPATEPAAPMEVQQAAQVQAVVAMPEAPAPVVIMTSTPGGKPAINMAAALSVFKYGIIALGGWIVSMILLGIVWGLSFYMALDSGGTTGMLILVMASLVTIIAYGQMIIYPVGKALKDGRADAVSFSYIDSWKTSIAGFVESVVVTGGLALMIGVGIGYEIPALSLVGGIGYFFFMMGYVPYMVRKAAEIMR
jgi:hypothetical protein